MRQMRAFDADSRQAAVRSLIFRLLRRQICSFEEERVFSKPSQINHGKTGQEILLYYNCPKQGINLAHDARGKSRMEDNFAHTAFSPGQPGVCGTGKYRAPTVASLMTAVKACRRSKDLHRGKQVHSEVVGSGLLNKFMANALINMYAKCGSMVDAKQVFDKMPLHDAVSYTVLMMGYLEHGDPKQALSLFEEIEAAEDRSFMAALMACTQLASRESNSSLKLKWLAKGKVFHSRVVMSGCCDLFVENALLNMYAKCGSMVHARAVFDRMVDHDVISFTALIQGYAENGESEVALELFQCIAQGNEQEFFAPNARTYVAALTACSSLAAARDESSAKSVLWRRRWLERGKAIHSQAVKDGCYDNFVESTLVDMYAKAGSIQHSRSVFDNMDDPDIVSWTALIMGYVENRESQHALELITRMDLSGAGHDQGTFVAALVACGNLVALETGKKYHQEICSCGLEQEVATSLVDFYARCGSLEIAKQVFDAIPEKTLLAWNTLMCGYSFHGETKLALEVLEEMRRQGQAPDAKTFVYILNAYSHAGLTDEGQDCFELMSSRYGIVPDMIHYSCMIDLLCRANHLDKALELVRSMPVEPNVVIWRTILGACRKWNNAEIGAVAYDALLKLDGEDAAAYNLMANIYASRAT